MLHLLMVEDNPGDVLLVREAICRSPIEADLLTAYDGEQALRFLTDSRLRLDLILLDLNIPKFSGHELLERFRSNVAPVIVLTSSVNPNDRKRAIESGAKDYIVKPSDLDEFLDTVATVLLHWDAKTFSKKWLNGEFNDGSFFGRLKAMSHEQLQAVKETLRAQRSQPGKKQ
jgi:DNA-binding response OmpR family regulator